MNKFVHILAGTLLLANVGVLAFAQNTPDGLEIMTKVFERPQPDDMEGSLTMTLENSAGATRIRSLRQYQAQFGFMEKKILFFTAPADVRDTSFMNWTSSDPSTPDEQWIYLPALRRVRRISTEKKNDSFMGSDFTYEDLGERHPQLDEHEITGTETIDGKTVYVVKSVLAGNSAYGSTISWVAKDIWIGLRREFHDHAGKLIKTLEINEYREIEGIWTITRMTMTNADTGHKTIMELSNLHLNTGMEEKLFSERTMTRGIR